MLTGNKTKVVVTGTTAASDKEGKTKLTLKELQEKQLSGEEMEQTAGNAADAGDYKFPSYEADRVHVELTKKVNDPIRKQYTDETVVKKFVPAQFDRMVKNNYFDTTIYDNVKVLHDPRANKPAPKVEATGARPWEPVEGLPTLQDAQIRYQQLYGRKAPAVSYEALLEFIDAKEFELDIDELEEQEQDENGGAGESGTVVRKAIRSTADAQQRYAELFNEEAPADKSFTHLKELIEAEEARREDDGTAD